MLLLELSEFVYKVYLPCPIRLSVIWFMSESFLPYSVFVWLWSVYFRQICLSAIFFFFWWGADLSCPLGIELAVKMLSTKHWTTTEFPFLLFLKYAEFASDLVLYSCFSLVHDTHVQLVFNACTLTSRFVLLLSLQSVFLWLPFKK